MFSSTPAPFLSLAKTERVCPGKTEFGTRPLGVVLQPVSRHFAGCLRDEKLHGMIFVARPNEKVFRSSDTVVPSCMTKLSPDLQDRTGAPTLSHVLIANLSARCWQVSVSHRISSRVLSVVSTLRADAGSVPCRYRAFVSAFQTACCAVSGCLFGELCWLSRCGAECGAVLILCPCSRSGARGCPRCNFFSGQSPIVGASLRAQGLCSARHSKTFSVCTSTKSCNIVCALFQTC